MLKPKFIHFIMSLVSIRPPCFIPFPQKPDSRTRTRTRKPPLTRVTHCSLFLQISVHNPQKKQNGGNKIFPESTQPNKEIQKKHSYPWDNEEEEEEKNNNINEQQSKSSSNEPFYRNSVPIKNDKQVSLPTRIWRKTWTKTPQRENQKTRFYPEMEVDSEDEEALDEDAADDYGRAAAPKRDTYMGELKNIHGVDRRDAMHRIVDKLKNSSEFDMMEEDIIDGPEFFGGAEGFERDPMGNWNVAHGTGDEDDDRPFPWMEKGYGGGGEDDGSRPARVREVSVAEKTIPGPELKRLQKLGMRLVKRVRVGNAGPTQDVVKTIHEKWKDSEVVKLKAEGVSAFNMKRTHQLLERRTGGLVVWRSGGSIVLYRGINYTPPQQEAPNSQSASLQTQTEATSLESSTYEMHDGLNNIDFEEKVAGTADASDVSASSHENNDQGDSYKLFGEYEKELDEILEGLGPRYTDWCGRGPMPVDADLLPGVVADYKTPYRLLPYRIRPRLSNMEMTKLRRLAKQVPPHFVLGRNRNHQGLASAMVKLWERSVIAKIAVKRSVQNTSNERMADELKRLTGGTLLSRNKEFIVFYRGKDFLAPSVSVALTERESIARTLQDEEEKARYNASAAILIEPSQAEVQTVNAGSLEESLEASSRWAKELSNEEKERLRLEAAKIKKEDMMKKLEKKLRIAQKKVARAEYELNKVEAFLMPAKASEDRETITDEERHMFRRLGLRMKAFLLLGRRGIFGGTVENMHLHWKHRELVKILSKEKTLEDVKSTARMLESQSGGILVSVDKISKGYAIIVYRGKNYMRPTTIKPRYLLTKREAYKRSIEIQRRKGLEQHIRILTTNVQQMQYDLRRYDSVDKEGMESLNKELYQSYTLENEESEDDSADEKIMESLNTETDLAYPFENEQSGDEAHNDQLYDSHSLNTNDLLTISYPDNSSEDVTISNGYSLEASQ